MVAAGAAKSAISASSATRAGFNTGGSSYSFPWAGEPRHRSAVSCGSCKEVSDEALEQSSITLWQASGAALAGSGRLSRRGSSCRRSSHRSDVLPTVMRVLGLVFAGTATDNRAEMTAFARDVLGLQGLEVEGASADMFALPDVSVFAVADPRGMGETSRSLGFFVSGLDDAIT